jgi:hypothetical protein
MIDLEQKLVEKIAIRLKNLRDSKFRKIPPEEISYGQKSAILRIEKGENTNNGNFITDVLLEEYTKYFKIEKNQLIFGNDDEINDLIFDIFNEILISVIPDNQKYKFGMKISLDEPDFKVKEVMLKLFYTFADFGRWYDLRKDTEKYYGDNPVDLVNMFLIIFTICEEKLTLSFTTHVINQVIKEEKFYFNRINEKLDNWLLNDFSQIVLPEIINKLESNSIFKIGYMAKSLIDKFLVTDLPESFLDEIPIQYDIPPLKMWKLNFEEMNEVQFNEMALRMGIKIEGNSIIVGNNQEGPIEELFKGIVGAELEVNGGKVGTDKLKLDDFIRHLEEMPLDFSEIHDLNHGRWKIPGVLTVNVQASNLFQERVSNTARDMIDSLVSVQNYFINSIEQDDLKAFSK